ncbi:DUF2637 domain-containing protein [Planotetraspora kaengkrachanensis]|uniref:DUF2637 domain-containing protein n=1 Tax=Planotetraspora kaengkrachanensis TaxID=575193 RepID=A0A8J3V6I2_9ACTN|nr:DUF2637 domain-containing protein [Planotetraspora kaengkrachanensis]GIG81147.1 hypothetical protein Pka01_42740 [Planotetraspora kaengkrachanensis]
MSITGHTYSIGDRLIRVSMTVVVLGVAAVAGWVSYWHAVAVIERYGAEDELSAHLVPVTVDGMIYASSMVLLWCARYQLKVPALARWALALGIAATLAANVLHGIERGALAAALAAWPAIALVIAYELTMWVIRSGREVAERAAVTTEEPVAMPDALADVPGPEDVGERPVVGDRELVGRGGLAGQARRAFAASLTDTSAVQDRVSDRADRIERADRVEPTDRVEPADRVERADRTSVREHMPSAIGPWDERPLRQGQAVPEEEQTSGDRRAQVAALLAQDPQMTGAAIGRALGMSEPHGRRLRREVLNEGKDG